MCKSLRNLFFLLLLASAAVSFAQEESPPPSEESSKTVEEPSSEDEVSQPKRPQRIPSSVPRSRNPKGDTELMKVLEQHTQNKESLIWLETPKEPFLAIWNADRSGNPKGALLIIHTDNSTPVWPILTNPLHASLPDYGWSTLAIGLPLPTTRKPPKRTLPVKAVHIKTEEQGSDASEDSPSNNESSSSASEPASTENPEDISTPTPNESSETEIAESNPSFDEQHKNTEADTITRLETALRFLHDKGQFNIVLLGSDAGALRAQRFIDIITPKIDNPRLKEKVEKPIRALIIVNGRNQLPGDDSQFKQWFTDPEIPILDMYFDTYQQNIADAKMRKTLAKQKQVTVYQQVKISSLNFENSWEENRLSRRIRGFMDVNASGVEVKGAKLQRYKQ